MTIAQFKESLRLCRNAGVSTWLWGSHGVGKSSVVRQFAEDNDWGFIDYRCSQIEPIDLRGLPERTPDGRTCYLPPAELPIADMDSESIRQELSRFDPSNPQQQYACQQRRRALQPRHREGILFLDELNRADHGVLNAVFQLVLDRGIGQYVLPPGWSVVVAGNHGDDYAVTDFNDKALLDRFCHLSFPDGVDTVAEWQEYIGDSYGSIADKVLLFTGQNINHLELNSGRGLEVQVEPSRRSWEAVVRVLQAFERGNYSKPSLRVVLAGLVGAELAIAFERFELPLLSPNDLFTYGVTTLESRLDRLGRPQLVNLMDSVARHVAKKMDDQHITDTVLDLLDWLTFRSAHNDHDLVVGFCRYLDPNFRCTGSSTVTAMHANPRLARRVRRQSELESNSTFHEHLLTRPQLYDALSKLIFPND